MVLTGAVALVMQLTVDDQLARQAERTLGKIFPNFEISIGSAKRVDGHGLLFRSIRFYPRSEQLHEPAFHATDPGNAATSGNTDSEKTTTTPPPLSIGSWFSFGEKRRIRPVLEVEQLQIACDTDWERLIQGQIVVGEIFLQRPIFRKRTLNDGRDSLTVLVSDLKTGTDTPQPGRIRIERGVVEFHDPRFRPPADSTSETLPPPIWVLSGLYADMIRAVVPSPDTALPTVSSDKGHSSRGGLSADGEERPLSASVADLSGEDNPVFVWNTSVRCAAPFMQSATLTASLNPQLGTASLQGEIASLQLTDGFLAACGIAEPDRQQVLESLSGNCDLRIAATLPAIGALDWKLDAAFRGFCRHPDYAQPFDRIDTEWSLTPDQFRLERFQTQWGATTISCSGDASLQKQELQKILGTALRMVSDTTSGALGTKEPRHLFALPEETILSEVIEQAAPVQGMIPELITAAEDGVFRETPPGMVGILPLGLPPTSIAETVAESVGNGTPGSAKVRDTNDDWPLTQMFERLFVGGQFQFHTRDLPMSTELWSHLPESQQELWDQISPEGVLDIKGEINGKNGQWTPQINARFGNLAFQSPLFPYRLQNGNGQVTLTPQDLTLDLTMFAESRQVRITGRFAEPLTDPHGAIHITADRIPIDEPLLKALPGPFETAMRQLGLQGSLNVDATRALPGGGRPASLKMQLHSDDLRVCYEKFPYEIDHIAATAVCDGPVWQIDAQGVHGTRPLMGRARVSPTPDNHWEIALQVRGEGIPFDESLRQSLPEMPRRIWDGLSPRGSADLLMQMVCFTGGRKNDLQIHASGWSDKTSLEPAIFPWRMEQVQGDLTYHNGNVRLRGFSALHNSTRLRCDADLFLAEDQSITVITQNLQVERLCFDQTLIQALPSGLRSIAWTARPTGAFLLRSGPGGISWVQRNLGNGRSTWVAHWDLFLDSQGNSFMSVVPIENVFGTTHLTGSATPDYHLGLGEIQLDSFIFQGIQVAKVAGPFSVENHRFSFGTNATLPPATAIPQTFPGSGIAPVGFTADTTPGNLTTGADIPSGLSLPAANGLAIDITTDHSIPLPNALPPSSSGVPPTTPSPYFFPTLVTPSGTTASRPLTAQVAEGFLEMSGWLQTDPEATYQTAISLRDANLAWIVGTRLPGRQSLSGRLSLNGIFAGKGSTAANMTGRGNLKLENADIHSIPVVFSMAQTSPGTKEQMTFRSVDVDFELLRNQMRLDRIELCGDSISFLGRGWWTFPSEIQLAFYSLLGRPDRQIPLLSQLLGNASRGLMEIQVSGTLDHPQIQTQALPAVAAIIEQFRHTLQ